MIFQNGIKKRDKMKKGNFILTLSIALLIPTFVAIYLVQTNAVNPISSNVMFLFGCGIELIMLEVVIAIDEITDRWHKKER